MDTIQLTKKLISIASYVDGDQNEKSIADFICEYIATNLPWLTIYKQRVDGARYNIIAYNSETPSIIFSSHMDTVLASGDVETRLNAEVVDDRLYGLGAVDMKGGLASSIMAAQIDNNKTPLALIFTCDEEYYFSGTNKLIQEFKSGNLPFNNKFKPDLLIYPEPSNLAISYGCRGCVELAVNIKGKSAHAGRPQLGINAIEKSVELVNLLKEKLRQESLPGLGFTTVNLASLNGGVGINGVIESRANAIADQACFVLDIRTSNFAQNAQAISKIIKKIAEMIGVKVQKITTKLNLLPYVADVKLLKDLENAIKQSEVLVKYNDDLTNSGYGEFAMVGAELGWNAVNFGPGPGQTSHQIREYVNLGDLQTTTQIYCELLKLLNDKS